MTQGQKDEQVGIWQRQIDAYQALINQGGLDMQQQADAIDAMANLHDSIVGLTTATDSNTDATNGQDTIFTDPRFTQMYFDQLGTIIDGFNGYNHVDGARAAGGEVKAGQMYKVNEGGANESFWKAPTDGRVLNARETQELARGNGDNSGGGDIHVHVAIDTGTIGLKPNATQMRELGEHVARATGTAVNNRRIYTHKAKIGG
jgi:SLT domain-containing protein